MTSTLQSIVSLQREHSSVGTSTMQQRGELVRDALRLAISEWRFEIANALGRYGDDLEIKGSDGAGRKALVPWTRLYSKRMSPAATKGWYIVYLFHPEGSGVSLCLSHGSTTSDGRNFKSISRTQAAELVSWGRSVLSDELADDDAVRSGVILGKQRLASAYERTALVSKFYASGSVPTDEELVRDLVTFSNALAKLYRADEAGIVPGSSSPEVVQILQLAEEMATPFKHPQRGQGWGLDAPAKKAVELRAMQVAEEWLTNEAFAFSDVSLTESCDFRAQRDGQDWVVEVKGTTAGPSSILLTRNEVALHRAAHPLNALLIVHGIKLGKDRTSASGGTLLVLSPWFLEDGRLSPTSYEYRLT
ncbi:MAG: DUF3578 domain-containing protein [Brevundimonas sp.]|nr:MAG: DUF3578 domain-containing protein [Brevundimonas sp.]